MFGGCPSFDPDRSVNDLPKLAHTTVLEFGEQTSYHFTMYWVVCPLTMNQLNSSLVDMHLSPIAGLIVASFPGRSHLQYLIA